MHRTTEQVPGHLGRHTNPLFNEAVQDFLEIELWHFGQALGGQTIRKSREVNPLVPLDVAPSSSNECMISLDLRNSSLSKRNFSNLTPSKTLDKKDAMMDVAAACRARALPKLKQSSGHGVEVIKSW